MPEETRWRELFPRLAVESIVVVLSIVLALVVNEWRVESEREDRCERATEAIRSELLHNHRDLSRVHPYHERLADTLFTLAGVGADSVDPAVRPHGWIRSVHLVSAAWEAARATGVTAQFPYETLLTLSRAYEQQATFRRQREDLIQVVLQKALGGDTPSLRHRPLGMAAAVNTLSDWEVNLLREYEWALGSLGVPSDSLKETG